MSHLAVRTAVASTFILSLYGCGGGGGGGGDSVAQLPVQQGNAQLNFSPSSVKLSHTVGMPGSFIINASVNRASDFSSVKPVYAVILDDKGLLSSRIDLSDSGGGNYQATLSLLPNLVIGHYSGSFQIQLCPDRECTTSYPGTASTLPYDLHVLPAISASAGTIIFGGQYGRDMESQQPVTFSLAPYAAGWKWDVSGMPSWLSNRTIAGAVRQASTTFNLQANTVSLPVGSTSATINVDVQLNGDSVSLPLTAMVNKDQHRLLASEAGVSMSATPRWSRLSQTVEVRDNFGIATSWVASSDKSWLTVTPSGRAGDSSSVVTLTANPALLSLDTLNYATVSIKSADLDIATAQIQVALWKGASFPAAAIKLAASYTTVIVDPIRPYAYANNGGSSIDVYHIYTGRLLNTISNLGMALTDMSVTRNGDKLFAIDIGPGNLTSPHHIVVVDLARMSKSGGWQLGVRSQEQIDYKDRITLVKPNGVDVVLVGNGTAYTMDGKRLGDLPFSRQSIGSNYGNIFASRDSTRIYNTTSAKHQRYDLDYSEVAGGTLFAVKYNDIATGGEDSDIAVSNDGATLYATGGNRPCVQFDAYKNPDNFRGPLPEPDPQGYHDFPNNVELSVDDNIYCGMQRSMGSYDIARYSPTGLLIGIYRFTGDNGSLIEHQMRLSSDGKIIVALTDDPFIVFVPVDK